MSDILSSLSSQVATASSRPPRRWSRCTRAGGPWPASSVAEDLVLTPAGTIDDDAVVVRRGDGHTAEGTVLGRTSGDGLAVIRVSALGVPPAGRGAGAQGRSPGRCGRPHLERWRLRLADLRCRGRRALADRSRDGDRARDSHRARTARRTHRWRVGRWQTARSWAWSPDPRSAGRRSSCPRRWRCRRRGRSWPPAARDKGSSASARPPSTSPSASVRGERRSTVCWSRDSSTAVPADAAGLLVGDVIVGFDRRRWCRSPSSW